MKLLRAAVAGGLLLTASGCTREGQPVDAALEDVDSARAAWAEQGLRRYQFAFRKDCFCVREAVEPVTIEVRDGVVTAVRSRNTGAAMPKNDALQWPTIEQLFREIREARNAGQMVRVEYHRSGYPVSIEIGSLAADAGVRYTVGNVRRIR